MLTRDQILAVVDTKSETVSVPEWGGEVICRALTIAERDELEAMFRQEGNRATASFRSKVIAMGCVDEDHNQLFTVADVTALSRKSASAGERIVDAVLRLSRVDLPGDDAGN